MQILLWPFKVTVSARCLLSMCPNAVIYLYKSVAMFTCIRHVPGESLSISLKTCIVAQVSVDIAVNMCGHLISTHRRTAHAVVTLLPRGTTIIYRCGHVARVQPIYAISFNK